MSPLMWLYSKTETSTPTTTATSTPSCTASHTPTSTATSTATSTVTTELQCGEDLAAVWRDSLGYTCSEYYSRGWCVYDWASDTYTYGTSWGKVTDRHNFARYAERISGGSKLIAADE